MCQEFTSINAILLENLGLPLKVTLLKSPSGGHAVTVFAWNNQLYVADNYSILGPAQNLAELLDMTALRDWDHFKFLNSWKDLRRGLYVPIEDYSSRSTAYGMTAATIWGK